MSLLHALVHMEPTRNIQLRLQPALRRHVVDLLWGDREPQFCWLPAASGYGQKRVLGSQMWWTTDIMVELTRSDLPHMAYYLSTVPPCCQPYGDAEVERAIQLMMRVQKKRLCRVVTFWKALHGIRQQSCGRTRLLLGTRHLGGQRDLVDYIGGHVFRCMLEELHRV